MAAALAGHLHGRLCFEKPCYIRRRELPRSSRSTLGHLEMKWCREKLYRCEMDPNNWERAVPNDCHRLETMKRPNKLEHRKARRPQNRLRILSKSWRPTICCNFIGKQQHATSLHSASLLRALGTSDQNVKPRGSSGLCCQAEAKKLTEARTSRNRIACSFPSNHNAAAMRCHKRAAGYDLFQPVQGFHFRACVMSLASHSIRSKWRSYWSLISPQSWWQPRSVSFRDVWSSGSLCPKEKGNNSNSSPLSSWWHVAPHVFKGHRKVQEHQRKNSQNMHIIALYNHFMPAHYLYCIFSACACARACVGEPSQWMNPCNNALCWWTCGSSHTLTPFLYGGPGY